MLNIFLGRSSIILLLISLLISKSVLALTIDGYEVPQVIPATSQNAELHLNGASLRTFYGVVDAYIGKLYVENPTTDELALVEADEYKRMIFRISMKRVSGRRIARAMYEALQASIDEEEFIQLEERLELLVNFFDKSLRTGEEGYIEWVPGEGSRIVIKDDVKGIIPGKDLNDAILRIWVGDNPVTHRFKEQILGIEEHQDVKKKRRRGRR